MLLPAPDLAQVRHRCSHGQFLESIGQLNCIFALDAISVTSSMEPRTSTLSARTSYPKK
ncbi:MAG: hypothetical protein MHM6MM_009262, partial [Cercozoa sp. M6MM]